MLWYQTAGLLHWELDMGSSIESRARSIGAGFEPARIVFDISRENKGVLDALVSQTPELHDAFKSVQKYIPLPKTAAPAMGHHFYRLPNHNRSFCYSLTLTDSVFNSPVLVFKGTEPLLQDFHKMIDWLLQTSFRRSSQVMADHFPIVEGKIPGALSLKEAIQEAHIALDVQQKHLHHYGELARMPTPLIIHSISEQKQNACLILLRQKLSQPAFQRIEPLLNNGLAVYIYHYPSVPVRSNYWGGPASRQLTEHIQTTFSEEAAVLGWVKLMVRLLYLGYLPYSVRNERLGFCLDSGNATLDGGFCDPDSILPIETSPDDEFFHEGLIRSLYGVQSTFQAVLGMSSPPDLYPSIDSFVCGQYIRKLVENALTSEARPQLSLDSRVRRLLSPRSVADVKVCTKRKIRVAWYHHFTRQSASLVV